MITEFHTKTYLYNFFKFRFLMLNAHLLNSTYHKYQSKIGVDRCMCIEHFLNTDTIVSASGLVSDPSVIHFNSSSLDLCSNFSILMQHH